MLALFYSLYRIAECHRFFTKYTSIQRETKLPIVNNEGYFQRGVLPTGGTSALVIQTTGKQEETTSRLHERA